MLRIVAHVAQRYSFLPLSGPAPQLPHQPDWTDTSRLVAFTLSDGAGGGLYVAFNTSHLPRLLKLPLWGGRVWQPLVDTSKVSGGCGAGRRQWEPGTVKASKIRRQGDKVRQAGVGV